MKVGGMKTWKKLMTGVQQLVRLLFNNNFINPGLVLYVKFAVLENSKCGNIKFISPPKQLPTLYLYKIPSFKCCVMCMGKQAWESLP